MNRYKAIRNYMISDEIEVEHVIGIFSSQSRLYHTFPIQITTYLAIQKSFVIVLVFFDSPYLYVRGLQHLHSLLTTDYLRKI